MWYVGYARSGREFEAESEVQALGYDAYVARRMDFKRVGNNRKVVSVVTPYLPNYVFMDLDGDGFHQVRAIKHIAPTLWVIPAGGLRDFMEFRKTVDREFDEQQSRKDSGERLEQFAIGQSLLVTDGPLADQLVTFRKTIEASHELHPKIEASADMMGQSIKVVVDPLHVRAAE
jgi:transcription antitermination factor NusG